ncbi:hypothetical protein [Brevibacillus sp. HD3.3A]|uniref:hypothetical protein n=1 Tax=Brevibacillus sp. HD3.3A TaxID=2738979 RepID=UPI00156ADF8C|nr:hypothetical protein [Brevibacillus sp. HD3.3A]UED72135.1 hypothetical protein HP435_28940 [Brevibacillus sp. HD3.3A]
MRDAEKDLALCEAATPGPWESLPDAVMASNIVLRWVCQMYDSVDVFPSAAADARFIAESRTALPHWIQRAVVAEAEVERLKNTMRSMSGSLIAWSMHLDDTVLTPLQFRELQRITKPLFEA